jgi:4-amino-4-deoxy-L-arabinose transferase-like glycosyltransferase
MPNERRLPLGDLALFLAVLAVAVGVRAWYLLACTDGGRSESPLLVQDPSPLVVAPSAEERVDQPPLTELQTLVANVREHRGFSGRAPLAATVEPTAHTSPGYPWLLAWLGQIPAADRSLERTVRWIQCGLGALTAAFYFIFCLQAFRSRVVAVVAGLACALHPFWVVNTSQVNDGVLASFLLAACILLGTTAGRTGNVLCSLLLGLSLAALALVRAALLPFAFVALLSFLLRCRTLRRGWLCALLAFLGFANGLAPWALRNYKTFGDVIPVVDSAFLDLWVGNNPRSTGGPQSEQTILETLAEGRGQETRQAADELAQLPQPERYRSLARVIARKVRDDPAGAFRHRLEACLAFLVGESWLRARVVWDATGQLPVEWLEQSYPALLSGSLLGMLVLALLGWRWTYAWRQSAQLSALALLFVPLPYFLGHAEALSGPRLPLDGVLLSYAAFALVYLVPMLGIPLRRGNGQTYGDARPT